LKDGHNHPFEQGNTISPPFEKGWQGGILKLLNHKLILNSTALKAQHPY
jgi:hypothetical protein